MAYLGFNLRISDGVSTVYLGTAVPLGGRRRAGSQLLAYPLAEPGETVRQASGEGDGAAIVGVKRENVNEGATVCLGPTFADAQAELSTINRLLRQAEERQEHGRGLPVYLELDVAGAAGSGQRRVLAKRDPGRPGGAGRRDAGRLLEAARAAAGLGTLAAASVLGGP